MKSLLHQHKSTIDNIITHEVDWDIPTSFVGQPINGDTIKDINLFADAKLIDYSSIYNSFSTVNGVLNGA